MTTRISQSIHALTPTAAKQLQAGHMEQLGIANSRCLAHAWYAVQYGEQNAWRDRMYADRLGELLEENGPPTRPVIELNDGWAIDTSGTLPHLDQVLEDSDRIIEERAGIQIAEDGAYRSYFQNILIPGDTDEYPSLLDFGLSSDLLATVSHAMQTIPVMSTSLPPGVRLVESNDRFDAEPERPKDSQLYHIDYYGQPSIYVLVLVRETTSEHGPWTFLPRTVSQRVSAELTYWEQGVPYRISDDDVYSHVDRSEAIEFTGKRGDVLFIESTACFHFGSRNSIKPRMQLMYGYTGACRSDFSELYDDEGRYPASESDSLLRRMVLDRSLLP